MTFPGPHGDDDDERIPTQAELDAEDLAELARTSRDADLAARYPRRPADPGPPPAALVRDAVWAWYLSAVAALVCVIFGFATLGATRARLQARLEPQMEGVKQIDAHAQASSMAHFWPLALLIGWLIAMALSYPLLVNIAKHHSRNLRSIYAALSVVIILFVPLISDLLFKYPEVSPVIRVLAWVSVGALLLSVLMTFRRAAGAWLPSSTRIKPGRVRRG
ncbi:hypothetical protein MYK68_01620 [Gordonia sp. PP30]|uniref:hypothetical protein n=1 Tax=unclassified Gordonia (in: high G+C Gram-positive bacteria) TaxID=2657482 RepID=UPI001FFF59EC|nr:hypothetical protein [Gordonia sp. PP30]UQE75358.1 hypothetical protein MYK68_01620 [Gordonia sp. PP30]